MKKFSKMFALMLLAGALVVGFASCSNDSSDSSNTNSSSSSSSSGSGNSGSGSGSSSSGATVSATYKLTENDKWQKIFLYSNDTCAWALEEAAELYPDGIIKKGKFTKSDGATWETGVFTIKWTQKAASMTEEKFTSCDGDSTLTVVQGTGTLTSGNEAPKVFTLQK